ncbi:MULTISPECIES: antitoxin [Streptomyces]|uniref:Antitoxin n=2 Tax=Streptomyces TaxID=1883 RepID=A0A1D8FVV6_9ACTN|nr:MULTISPECIES: antitoxin [Streptomyces]AOT57340.1 hypothetical protein A4G23_00126 [Streptomyces rubrolavendulae]KAF0646378.1 hypothetical protein K701_28920 [Streptomyces fradiae ATCC 10745 = DSM 40063]OSY48978.1 hypothetical protein BG846_05413 [Streptomyces fradiae ATCC 10745 = DSM 40063]QEV10783.1 antitoxin [Streptomyces fradiae ATCC 10745 = DSM 40063]
MSVTDKLKNLLKGHEGQVGKGVDKAGDYVDKRTHGRFGKHVDTAQERLKDRLGREPGQRREPPAQP